MQGEMKFLNRKLITDKCGFKNFISTAQFQVLGEIDRFLMTDLGLKKFKKKRAKIGQNMR